MKITGLNHTSACLLFGLFVMIGGCAAADPPTPVASAILINVHHMDLSNGDGFQEFKRGTLNLMLTRASAVRKDGSSAHDVFGSIRGSVAKAGSGQSSRIGNGMHGEVKVYQVDKMIYVPVEEDYVVVTINGVVFLEVSKAGENGRDLGVYTTADVPFSITIARDNDGLWKVGSGSTPDLLGFWPEADGTGAPQKLRFQGRLSYQEYLAAEPLS